MIIGIVFSRGVGDKSVSRAGQNRLYVESLATSEFGFANMSYSGVSDDGYLCSFSDSNSDTYGSDGPYRVSVSRSKSERKV